MCRISINETNETKAPRDVCVKDIGSQASMVLPNYQNFIEMTSNMIHVVTLGVDSKCPRKIHLKTHSSPAPLLQSSVLQKQHFTPFKEHGVWLSWPSGNSSRPYTIQGFSKGEKLQSPWRRSKVRRWRGEQQARAPKNGKKPQT